MKRYYKKTISTFKKWNRIFCSGIVCRVNVKRDVLIVMLAVIIATVILGANYYISKKNKEQNKEKIALMQELIQEKLQENFLKKFEEENAGKVLAIQEKFDSLLWKEYRSNWYGFKIEYPQSWLVPSIKHFKQGSKADYRISFLANDDGQRNFFIGFDVVVYDVNKVKDLFVTDEFPSKKDSQLNLYECDNIRGHILETGDYPAEEIYIPPTDNCYNPVLFFSVTRGQYIYNIVPILKQNVEFYGDPMIGVSDDLPEFFMVIAQFENIEIIRPKPKPKIVQPKITAPYPVSYKKDSLGRLVCAKKNDKPKKSDTKKKKHLDMECCLDPDEYPNPHCYYPADKYGKYLK